MNLKKTLLIAATFLLLGNTAADTNPDYWAEGGQGWNVTYQHGNNEEYCEEIYWEDEYNCIDWEDDLEEISQKRCEELVFDSTREKCFELLSANINSN